MSIRNSVRLKKVLELILALGNYMNSNRKGVAAGFKIQSLSRVSCMFLRLVTLLNTYLSGLIFLSATNRVYIFSFIKNRIPSYM